ncbi:MAG: hypothetical protein HQL73_11395 [Magnetococcales bacterium]|nr:hypothetical protein [Magnetococcales bacterium]
MPDFVSTLPFHSGRHLITCILPADGMDTLLLTTLQRQLGRLTGCSSQCRGYSNLNSGHATTEKPFTAQRVSVVTVTVEDEHAGEVFDFLAQWIAQHLNTADAFLYQTQLHRVSPYELPFGLPDEQDPKTAGKPAFGPGPIWGNLVAKKR